MAAKELQAPYELVREVAERGALPVVLFTAGGIATPADAAMMMQLGRRRRVRRLGHLQVRQPGRSGPTRSSRRPCTSTTPDVIAKVSRGLGEAMVGINVEEIPPPHRLAERGW